MYSVWFKCPGRWCVKKEALELATGAGGCVQDSVPVGQIPTQRESVMCPAGMGCLRSTRAALPIKRSEVLYI